MDRRTLIRRLVAGLAIPLAPIRLAKAAERTGRRLILVELAGANDGLNTVVPYRDHRYGELRPGIGLGGAELFTLTDELALHHALTPLDAAWQAGDLAIVQGLGYPGQNRSHFKSIALWETGGDGSGSGTTGWLTEDIEGMVGAEAVDAHGISLDGGMGIFASPSGVWLSMTSLRQFTRLKDSAGHLSAPGAAPENPALALLMERGQALDSAMTRISAKIEHLSRLTAGLDLGAGEFGRQAALAAQLVEAGIDAPVLKLKIAGFDTHEAQPWQHGDLLRDLARGLAGLRDALIRSGHWGQTLVMTYSEFGRRAVENQSLGTDHGTAAPHFLLGGALSSGVWGVHPDLGALDEGDMRFTMDYRSVYHAILQDWFGLERTRFAAHADRALEGLFTAG